MDCTSDPARTPREEDGKEGVDIEVILSSSMLKYLAIRGCENLTHEH